MNRVSLDMTRLRAAYASGATTPESVVLDVLERIGQDRHCAWIEVLDRERLTRHARALAARGPADLPLYGIPFAIKDNIDLEGVATTAGCPGYRYLPTHSAPVVQRLIDAGAMPIGKTNLDQFATGLNGTRSPFGACQNAFDTRYISGGSSSGSAVAVALGQVSFALGTDTAGSGRVPASFNHLVGLKPTRGLLSARGVVPACRTLDTVSILALTADDAHRAFAACLDFDAADAYARPSQPHGFDFGRAARARLGVPLRSQWQFPGAGGDAGGDAGSPGSSNEYARAYALAIEHARHLGAEIVEVDFEPFFETARLLYGGPWVAERYQAIRGFVETQPEALFPVTREITLAGARPSAADAFAAQYRLRELERSTEDVWQHIDALFMPTAPLHPTIEAMQAAPIELNSALGTYTNFVNLLDLSAIAVPFCFVANGLPFGVTLAARAHQDVPLLHYARRWQESLTGPAAALGTSSETLAAAKAPPPAVPSGQVRVVQPAGARAAQATVPPGARWVATVRSAPRYRQTAEGALGIAETQPGQPVSLDLWEFGRADFAAWVTQTAPGGSVGPIELEDGTHALGLLAQVPLPPAPASTRPWPPHE